MWWISKKSHHILLGSYPGIRTLICSVGQSNLFVYSTLWSKGPEISSKIATSLVRSQLDYGSSVWVRYKDGIEILRKCKNRQGNQC